MKEKPQTALFFILINDRRSVFIVSNGKFSTFHRFSEKKGLKRKFEFNLVVTTVEKSKTKLYVVKSSPKQQH